MKNLFKKLVVAALSVSCVIGAAGCSSNVENGSKIETLTVTFDIGGTEKSVDFKLYLNYAPGTIEHVKYLVGKNYYDNTLVSNVNKHIEFGEYEAASSGRVSKYSDAATLSYVALMTHYSLENKTLGSSGSRKSYYNDGKLNEGYTLNGEFEANGFKNNKLDFSNGALVLKRETGKKTSDADYFDTARATLAVTFGTDSYYDNTSNFVIIGKIKKSADVTELKKLIGTEYTENDGDITYCYKGETYLYKDGKYYALENGEFNKELDADGDLVKEFKDNSKLMEIIPTKTITVKSVRLSK